MDDDRKLNEELVNKQKTLPNGMTIISINEYETKYLYEEIFNKEIYLKSGIEINNKSVILDVGANIGFFSLWVQNKFPGATIFAFEPIPDTFKVLKLNMAGYAEWVKVYNIGLSDKVGELDFIFYPHYSVLSGYCTNDVQDSQFLKAAFDNSKKGGLKEGPVLENLIDNYINEEFLSHKKQYRCPVTTISSFFHDHDISSVDLLKLDVENAEEDVLKGILDQDWVKIKQIVLESHNLMGDRTDRITKLLHTKGFRTTIEEIKPLQGSGALNIYAIRK